MHLGGELFKLTAGIDLLHVPFKGAAPALIDVVGGHTHLAFATDPVEPHAYPLRQAEGVRRRRASAQRPDPRRSDHRRSRAARLRGRQLDRHRRAAGTPAAIIAKLHKEISEILDTPEMQKQFANEGADVVRMSPADSATSSRRNWRNGDAS